jgi:HAD superfamily hydrolase (TIGR01484 family)
MSILANPKSIRALALDLDGTLLAPETILTERTISVVKKCMERGLKIIIVTGRSIEGSERFRTALGAEGPMVYFNGAVIAEMPGSRILSATLMDAKAAEFCVDLAREIGVHCQVHFPTGSDDGRITLMANRDGPEREMYHKHTGVLSELGNLKESLHRSGLEGCVKTMFLAEPEILAELRLRLDKHFAGSIYITQTMRTFLELMDAKASKGKGLCFVLERLSIKK